VVIQSLILIVVTAFVTWLVMFWARLAPGRARSLSLEEREADRAKDIGVRLDGARDRASGVELERNKLALAKAVKAALWVTDARLNVAVPQLLKMAQRWASQAEVQDKKWKAPEGVTDIQGLDDPRSPWAAWTFDQHRWRIEAEWGQAELPDESERDLGTCRVLLDDEVVLDMTVSGKDLQVMWIDALTVGPWVSDLLNFAGARTSDAKARSSARSARQNQERADNIRWS
jgi:hypothetical protein